MLFMMVIDGLCMGNTDNWLIILVFITIKLSVMSVSVEFNVFISIGISDRWFVFINK